MILKFKRAIVSQKKLIKKYSCDLQSMEYTYLIAQIPTIKVPCGKIRRHIIYETNGKINKHRQLFVLKNS